MQRLCFACSSSFDLGERKFKGNGKYYIEKKDKESFNDGDLVRLMDNINVLYKDGKFVYKSKEYIDFKNHESSEKKIIHYLPVDPKQVVNATVFKPDHSTIQSVAERNISSLKVGDIIQFERFGFCRLDSIDNLGMDKIYHFWFTH